MSQALDRILAIEKPCEWEILVGDDGSSDGTEAIVREWMAKAGIDDGDLKRLVAQKGHFSTDTPIDRYPEKFVTDWLMHNWSQVVTAIHNDPEYAPF